MPTRIVVLAALSAALGWCTTPAGAREWAKTPLDVAGDVWLADIASSDPGSATVLYNAPPDADGRWELQAATRAFGDPFAAPQVLDVWTYYPALAASPPRRQEARWPPGTGPPAG